MELAQLGVQVLNLNVIEAGSSCPKRQGAAGRPADAVHDTDEPLNDPHLRNHIVFVTRKHPTRCGYVGSGKPSTFPIRWGRYVFCPMLSADSETLYAESTELKRSELGELKK